MPTSGIAPFKPSMMPPLFERLVFRFWIEPVIEPVVSWRIATSTCFSFVLNLRTSRGGDGASWYGTTK